MISPLGITVLVFLCLIMSAANLAMSIYVLVEYKPNTEGHPQGQPELEQEMEQKMKEQTKSFRHHTTIAPPPNIQNTKFGKQSYHKINTIRDLNANIIIFDIFVRNGLLVAICANDTAIDIHQLKIKYGSESLPIQDHFECKKWEPFHILTFALSSATDHYVAIDVCLDTMKETIVLYHQPATIQTNIFATHLNLYQVQYTTIWQSFMEKSAIDDFILYYNGHDDTMDSFAASNVLVIRWPFPYHSIHQPQNSYAQIAQLNHALYKYGCFSNYIANIDVDEFPLITPIQQSLLKQTTINGILFANHWIVADNMNGLISVNHRYQNYRSKYIVAVNAVKALRIHKPWVWNSNHHEFDEKSVMRHVCSWQTNRPKAVLDEIQLPTNVKLISFLNQENIDLPLPIEEEVYDYE